MIERLSESYEQLAKNTISDNKFQNIYMYIDVLAYGFFEDGNINTYLLSQGEDISVIIYNYHNSLQLMEVKEASDESVKELADYIVGMGIKRISGPRSLSSRLINELEDSFFIEHGFIMKYRGEKVSGDGLEFAKKEDFKEIATLICSDGTFSSSYVLEDLYVQLLNRYKFDKCENAIVRINGKIVSHFATYVINDEMAVLSGMVTDPAYRGRGIGGKLVKQFSSYIYNSGRIPVLYSYEEGLYKWYQKLGYEIISDSSKIVFKAQS